MSRSQDQPEDTMKEGGLSEDQLPRSDRGIALPRPVNKIKLGRPLTVASGSWLEVREMKT